MIKQSNMVCIPYQDSYMEDWDNFILSCSINGTFLHSRKFLSYHGEKFKDMSLLIFDYERLVAVFPAALDVALSDVVVNHPGVTFGGLVVDGKLRGEAVIQVFGLIKNYYSGMKLSTLRIKHVPSIYCNHMYHDDTYAMFRLGANRYRCDLGSTIDLQARGKLTKGRKYEINKGRKKGVEIVEGIELLDEIHLILEDNLKRAHNAKPVHTKGELQLLHSMFPKDVCFLAAKVDDDIVAGLIMFNHQEIVAHTQYIASSPVAHEFGALDFLIDSAICQYGKDGFKYFDFGISNEDGGNVLNENLYRYKRSFGAGSITHEFFELNLRGGDVCRRL